MSYQEFLNEIREMLNKKLGHKVSVMIQRVVKDKEEKLGIVIKGSSGMSIAPILYLEDVYKDFMENGNIEKCVLDILARNKKYTLPNDKEQALLEEIVNWGKMSKYVYPLLINTERNIEQLIHMDHRSYLDLSLCYVIKIQDSEQKIGFRITRVLSQVWNVTEEELYQTAIQNMKKDGYTIKSIFDTVENIRQLVTTPKELEVLDKLQTEELKATEQMYILTNKENKCGATGLLDVDMIRGFSEKHKADVFIIPASIHELILMLDSPVMDGSYIKEMVEEVNRKELHESEVLSDNVYYYSRALGKVICLH